LGGDELALDLDLGADTRLQMRSVAAMVVQAGGYPAAARWTVAAALGTGAALDWHPQPTVVCDGAELHSQVTVALQRGAHAVLREEVVLGRANQVGGRFVGELTIELEGAPLLAHTMLLDGADPVFTGPAGTGGAGVVGMLAIVGEGIDRLPEGAGEVPGLRWACSALDGPGCLLLALGDRVVDVSRLLDQAVQDWPRSARGVMQNAVKDGDGTPGEVHAVAVDGGPDHAGTG
jgi:urease accessory protein